MGTEFIWFTEAAGPINALAHGILISLRSSNSTVTDSSNSYWSLFRSIKNRSQLVSLPRGTKLNQRWHIGGPDPPVKTNAVVFRGIER